MAERNRSEPFIEDADRFPEDGTRTRRPPSPDQETRRRKTQQRRRRNSVFQYIAVLFMAAFVLLLFTFMMERRQSQQQIDDLKQSASTVQTLQGLIDENSSLKLRLAELEEQLEQQKSAAGDLTVSLDGVTDTLSHTENLLAWTTQAMDYFWQINDAYVRGRTQLCRELITQLESPETTPAAGPLMEYLPKENSTGTDRYSPYDRYMEIRGKVIK
ncbi:hypothetical protein [Lawsonibacter sp. JLR.KK007]|jgi:septal ring factor EnvC (AmiA/AmiB activator)|uniref:hypothetical protein n=1 Tax=Lawsonibacter sp. JLR.KK007 TaxID=3114293 RepID=UPI002FF0EE67